MRARRALPRRAGLPAGIRWLYHADGSPLGRCARAREHMSFSFCRRRLGSRRNRSSNGFLGLQFQVNLVNWRACASGKALRTYAPQSQTQR
eukprot:scaffold45824_cov60-Phaeocystis_antarctica.AAC.1